MTQSGVFDIDMITDIGIKYTVLNLRCDENMLWGQIYK